MNIYYFSPQTLFYWLVAFSIYEWVAIYIILAFSQNKYRTPVEYYTKLPSWVSVSGDFIYSTAIFLTAQLVFKMLEQSKTIKMNDNLTKVLVFLGIIIATQWIYDLTFAFIVMNIPNGFSKYVSFFQRYIKEVNFGAVISDSIWLVGWLFLTMILIQYVSLPYACLILTLSLFAWLVIKF